MSTVLLTYEDHRRSRPARVRRRAIAWGVAATCLVAVTISANRYLPRVRQYYALLADERRAAVACGAHTFPAATVVFDERVLRPSVGLWTRHSTNHEDAWFRTSRFYFPTREPILTGDTWVAPAWPAEWYSMRKLNARRHGGIWCEHGLRPGTPCVSQASGATADDRFARLVFLHRRLTPGTRRPALVVMSFDAPAFTWGASDPFHVVVHGLAGDSTISGGDGWHGLLPYPGGAPGQPIQLLAGQPDAVDPSRFTIAVRHGDAPALIECRLNEDFSISMSLR